MLAWSKMPTTLMSANDLYFLNDESVDQFIELTSPISINTNQHAKYRSIPFGNRVTVISREVVKNINPSEDFEISVKLKCRLNDKTSSTKSLGLFLDPLKTGKFPDNLTLTKLFMTGADPSLELTKDRILLLKENIVFTFFDIKDILNRLGSAISRVLYSRRSSNFNIVTETTSWTITVSMSEAFSNKIKDAPFYTIEFPGA